MKAVVTATLMLLAPAPAGANEWFQKPDATDITMQGVFTGLMLADWAQTLNVTQGPGVIPDRRWPHGRPIWETNVLLGRRPSSAEVNRYFAGSILGHALVAWALPRPWRNAWQSAGIMVEVYYVGTNVRNGVRLTIKF